MKEKADSIIRDAKAAAQRKVEVTVTASKAKQAETQRLAAVGKREAQAAESTIF